MTLRSGILVQASQRIRSAGLLAFPPLVTLLFIFAWQSGSARAAAFDAALAPDQATGGHTHDRPAVAGDIPTTGAEYAVDGILSVIWGDTQDGAGIPPLFFVRDAKGREYRAAARPEAVLELLQLAGRPVSLRVNDVAPGAAPGLGGLPVPDVVVNSVGSPPGVPAPSPAPAITGSHPWVTVLCKFQDVAAEPWTPGAVSTLMTSSVSAPGLDFYWRQVSYNKFNIAGSFVAGDHWYTLPFPRDHYGSLGVLDFNALVADCTGAANADVNFSTVDGVNMMFNSLLNIGGAINAAWGGSATVPYDGAGVKRVTWMPTWANEGVLAHETGHGFGLHHSWSGYGTAYGSQWDVMSSIGQCHSSDPTWGCHPVHTISDYKDQLGLFDAASKFTPGLNSKQTIQLWQLDELNTGPGVYMMARIPSLGGAGGSGFDYYTIELRRQSGPYDINTPAGPTGAIVVHEVLSTRLAGGYPSPARVVDLELDGDAADCSSTVFCADVPNDARWVTGEIFSDPANQVLMRIISLGANHSSATVGIRYGSPPLSSTALRFEQQPAALVGNGVVLMPAPTVSLVDVDTLPNTGDNSSVVTLSVVPAGATVFCTGGNSRTAVAGIATFDGCTVSGSAGAYQLAASAPGQTTVTSTAFSIADVLDCDLSECDVNFSSDSGGFTFSGLWHRETVAAPSGMTGPMIAYNSGCTGPGTTGCTYDSGSANAGSAVSSIMNLGNARMMTFKTVRLAGNTACFAADTTTIQYSDNGISFYPLQLGGDAGSDAGTQYASGEGICGDSASAQSFSVVLPAGTSRVSFGFNTITAANNANPGWFIDDITFSQPLPAGVRLESSTPDSWYASVPFGSPGQPVATIRTANGTRVSSDNSTQVTVSLFQNGSSAPPLVALAGTPADEGGAPTLETGRAPGTFVPAGPGAFPAVPAPPAGTLTCAGGLTATALNGVAQFSGCQVNALGSNYQVVASSAGLSWSISAYFNIETPTLCDAGACASDLTVAPPWTFSGLFHRETVASVSGMSTPMAAWNFGCTGPGVTGCSYDNGSLTSGGFRLPLISMSGANRLQFKVARDTGTGACPGEDDLIVYYTFDRMYWYALNLQSAGTISPGSMSLVNWAVCGNSLTAQTVNVTLPSGIAGLWVYFWPGDTTDNNHAGVFVDDVKLEAPPTKLAFAATPVTGTPNMSLTPLTVEVWNSLNQVVTSDNSTVVSLAKASGPGVLTCPAVVAVSGVASFANCSVSSAGTYTLQATSSPPLTSAFSGTITVANAAGPVLPAYNGITNVTQASLTVHWIDNASDELGYQLYRIQGATVTLVPGCSTTTPNLTSCTDTGLTPGTYYAYQVWAYNGSGFGYPGTYMAGYTRSTAPVAPRIGSAAGTSGSSIRVDWVDNSSNELGFKVYEYTGGGLVLIATTAANATSYPVIGLAPSTTHSYVVTAYNSGGETYSNAGIFALTQPASLPPAAGPARPIYNGITNPTQTSLTVNWFDMANNELGYQVYRIQGGTVTLVPSCSTSTPNLTSCTDTGLSPGTYYVYQVWVYNAEPGGFSYPETYLAGYTTSTAPAAPTMGSAAGMTSSTIRVQWLDNSANETGFRVYEYLGGVFTLVGTVPANQESLIVGGLAPASIHVYVVTAYNSGGETYANAGIFAQVLP